VVNLVNVYSSALQALLTIKIWDTHWCWGIHLSLAMPGRESTAVNIELALDESWTSLPMSLCHSEPFRQGSGENCVWRFPSEISWFCRFLSLPSSKWGTMGCICTETVVS
jgi:hypothetical protein